MKVGTITTIERILSGIRINRLTDKGAKAVLLKDYLSVRRIARMTDAEKDEIVRKFQQDWKEAILDESKRDEAFHDAEADANDALRDIEEREEEIVLEKVKAEALYDPDLWADDILLAQIPGSIDYLVENGVAE